jgi:hypothetical protein
MYPSYERPHRSLGSDNITGIQDLYGLVSNGQDGDQDELLVTGTTLTPETTAIQEQGSNWFITSVQFYDAPAFCTQ